MQLTLKVLNIWGRPCSGKSTLAAALFNIMKSLDQKVELVTEYAKDLTYEKNFGTLENQLKVFAEQDARLRRLEGQVEWAITDSPLGLGEVYMTDEYSSWLPDAMRGAYHRYDNWDVWVHGVKKYQQYGRTQSEPAALALDAEIKAIYKAYTWHGENTFSVEGNDMAAFRIFEDFLCLDFKALEWKGRHPVGSALSP
jgi:energy-coupling factor transporter ATP-binding protein EcfA2